MDSLSVRFDVHGTDDHRFSRKNTITFASIRPYLYVLQNMELSRPILEDKLFLITVNALNTAIDWHTVQRMAYI